MLLLILLVILAFAVFQGIGLYKGLAGSRCGCRNAFAQVAVQLGRRYDLVPELIDAAAPCLEGEQDTLDAVGAAREAAVSALAAARAQPEDDAAMRQLTGADVALMQALARVSCLLDGYPAVKAEPRVSQIREELASTENKIAFARQAYNEAVGDYNARRERFPFSLIARAFSFQPAGPLSAEPAGRA